MHLSLADQKEDREEHRHRGSGNGLQQVYRSGVSKFGSGTSDAFRNVIVPGLCAGRKTRFLSITASVQQPVLGRKGI